ncbi:hypothetical protein PIB30_108569, partial [Stylosanthes scabra]|nr:hypothetical protein [Stylosanthes scabra]
IFPPNINSKNISKQAFATHFRCRKCEDIQLVISHLGLGKRWYCRFSTQWCETHFWLHVCST